VQSLALPEELEKHLDKVSSMGMIKDLNRYTQFEAADSIQVAAANEGGVAGIGTGMGAGLAMGQMMANSFAGVAASNAKPSAVASEDPIALLEKLDGLLKKGILTQAEFDAKKVEILSQIK
ncbi:MAG: SHOCT domain-containing protein, partial [Pseudomonadota bacterium]